MSLNDLASLGSFVNGLAVLISLGYLAIQVRQAEKNQQASIRQGRAMRISDQFMAIADPSVAEATSKGMVGDDSISSVQLVQYSYVMRAVFSHIDDSYFQHKEGLLTEDAFSSIVVSLHNLLALPGARAQWKRLRGSFAPDFVAFMDKALAETRMIPPSDDLARWKAELAAQREMVQ